MNMLTIPTGTDYMVENTASFDELSIPKGASLRAPEGKLLTMTVGGKETAISEGIYKNVVLSLTDSFASPVKGYKNDHFRTALYVKGNEIEENKSVYPALQGGSFSGNCTDGVTIVSENDNFNGIVVVDSEYVIKNVTVKMTGFGENDFCGKGASILAAGKSKVTIDGAKIENRGVLRPAVLAGDEAEVLVKNSDIMVYGGTEAEENRLKESSRGFVLTSVPWMLGLTGNSRATNVVSRASVTYENSTIRGEKWGVLSTDGVDTPKTKGDCAVRLTARKCLVEITGDSGYGSYSIGACRNTFDNCVFNCPDYALIIANETASGEFINHTVVNTKRFGVMWHQNQGGRLIVKDSEFNTGMTTFLVKACYPVIEVENSVLNSGNGVILQLMDLDDPGMGPEDVIVDTAVAVKDMSHNNTEANYQDTKIFSFNYENYCTDMKASFKNMELKGDFYNAVTNACGVGTLMPETDGNSELPPGAPPEGPGGEFVPPPHSTEKPINMILSFNNVKLTGVISASAAKHGVSQISGSNRIELGQVTNTVCPAVNNGVIVNLANGSKWTVTGDCHLTSLTIENNAIIEGGDGKKVVMTVDGVHAAIEDGSYKGNIYIRVFD